MTWSVPVKDYCPECGKTLFKLAGKGKKKPFCINEECSAFLPEDQRGYKKKTAESEGEEAEVKKSAAKKAPAKKPAAKRGRKSSAAKE